MNENKNENSMLTGVIWKEILLFFFPILIGTFFQQLYNTVDAIIVGRFAGKEALSSVGGSAALTINLAVGFFTGLTNGGSVLISQYFGAKQHKKIEECLHTSYAFAVVGGILVGIVGFLASPAIMQIMNTPAEIIDGSTLYIRVYFVGIVFVFLYNMGASILRAMGDSKRPLYYLIVCTLINIVLDFALVLGLQMGVLGVAIATLVAQAVSAFLVTNALARHTDGVELHISQMKIEGKMLQAILRIGLPAGIQSSMYALSNMIIQSALNILGVDAVAAWAAYGKIDVLFWMICGSFGIAVTTFVGQNYGAGNLERMRKGTRVVMAMDMGMALVFMLFISNLGGLALSIFTTDANVIALGVRQIRVLAPAYVVFVVIEILSGTLRAQGHTLVTTIISLVCICLFRVVWVTVFAVGHSMEVLILCYPLSWVFSALANTIYYIYKEPRIIREFRAKREVLP